jgi:hypothetical protein
MISPMEVGNQLNCISSLLAGKKCIRIVEQLHNSTQATRWLRRLSSAPLNRRLVQVGFVVYKVTLRLFSQVLQISLVSIIPPVLHIHSSLADCILP